jgi:hypothetical protein
MDKRNQKKEKLNDRKLDNDRKQVSQKRSIEYPDQLKQVENKKKWKDQPKTREIYDL